MEKKVLTEKEIEKKINDLVAIWGIEGMEFTEEELDRKRAFLRGEISEEDFLLLKNLNSKKFKLE